MTPAIGNYPRVEFVSVGTPQEELSPTSIQERFVEALSLANEQLEREAIVYYIDQWPEDPVGDFIDPDRNILLGILTQNGDEPIDIIDLKGLDETTIKSVDALALEMVLKVRQHLVAKKTKGIFISRMGTKFDHRFQMFESFRCDEEGYLRFYDCRLLYLQKMHYRVIKADEFHSNTVCRILDVPLGIRLFDDYDLVRRDHRGMFIETDVKIRIPLEDVAKMFRVDAEKYQGFYLILERYELTHEEKEWIIARYRKFPEAP